MNILTTARRHMGIYHYGIMFCLCKPRLASYIHRLDWFNWFRVRVRVYMGKRFPFAIEFSVSNWDKVFQGKPDGQ
jgi:hypothetical protein